MNLGHPIETRNTLPVYKSYQFKIQIIQIQIEHNTIQIQICTNF